MTYHPNIKDSKKNPEKCDPPPPLPIFRSRVGGFRACEILARGLFQSTGCHFSLDSMKDPFPSGRLESIISVYVLERLFL